MINKLTAVPIDIVPIIAIDNGFVTPSPYLKKKQWHHCEDGSQRSHDNRSQTPAASFMYRF